MWKDTTAKQIKWMTSIIMNHITWITFDLCMIILYISFCFSHLFSLVYLSSVSSSCMSSEYEHVFIWQYFDWITNSDILLVLSGVDISGLFVIRQRLSLLYCTEMDINTWRKHGVLNFMFSLQESLISCWSLYFLSIDIRIWKHTYHLLEDECGFHWRI